MKCCSMPSSPTRLRPIQFSSTSRGHHAPRPSSVLRGKATPRCSSPKKMVHRGGGERECGWVAEENWTTDPGNARLRPRKAQTLRTWQGASNIFPTNDTKLDDTGRVLVSLGVQLCPLVVTVEGPPGSLRQSWRIGRTFSMIRWGTKQDNAGHEDWRIDIELELKLICNICVVTHFTNLPSAVSFDVLSLSGGIPRQAAPVFEAHNPLHWGRIFHWIRFFDLLEQFSILMLMMNFLRGPANSTRSRH